METQDREAPGPILQPGRNCHELYRGQRVAFLVDAAAYYEALVETLRGAQRSILIAGWDMDSRLALLRGRRAGEHPRRYRLRNFLDGLVRDRDGLDIHILSWDFPLLYAMEREALPIFQLGWKSHRRIHFRLDGEHPLGGSHHQKIVVVDDRVAFCGGIDLTRRRWDMPAHDPHCALRLDPDGKAYGPFHDVQMMVSGEAAAALGTLLRRRWQWATGESVAPPQVADDVCWPETVPAQMEAATLGIVRTLPAYRGRAEVREVESLYRDAIAAAEHSIYIENQYLTSPAIAEALCARLQEAHGPEVVLLINLISTGWLETSTMDAIRGQLVQRLRDADRFGRCRIYCPVTHDGAREVDIKVHAKLMVVDDRLARIGSANLNNRSMGLDTECDLAVEAREDSADRAAHAKAIVGLRNGLLAEHLGTDAATVGRAVDEQGGLIAAIERLNRGSRGLRPLTEKAEPSRHLVVPDAELVDPERPVELDQMIDCLVHEEEPPAGARFRWAWLLRGLVLLVLLGALVAVWRVTPLGDLVDREALIAWGGMIENDPWAVAAVLGAYLLAGLVVFPVTVLIGATAAVFDPLAGAAYALGGSLLSATMNYALGSWLGQGLVRRLGGSHLNRISRRLARRGVTSVVLVRILPIAPFALINLIAGASHLRLRDFIVGTVLGMAPGIVGITLVVGQLKTFVVEPSVFNLVALGLVAAVMLGAGAWLARRARRSRHEEHDGGSARGAGGT